MPSSSANTESEEQLQAQVKDEMCPKAVWCRWEFIREMAVGEKEQWKKDMSRLESLAPPPVDMQDIQNPIKNQWKSAASRRQNYCNYRRNLWEELSRKCKHSLWRGLRQAFLDAGFWWYW